MRLKRSCIVMNELLDTGLSELLDIPIVAICFVIGFIVKNYTKLPNKFIPLMMMGTGIISNIAIILTNHESLNAMHFICGAISGLASTGSYELIVNTFGLKKSKNDEPPDDEIVDESTEE